MCIRDSVGPGAADNYRTPALGRDRLAELLGRKWVLIVLDAVSYTHLRAHETVLDIVCRLLLEKKQQSVNTIPHQYNHETQLTQLH